MILILFLQGVDPNIAVFFATHFLICHSFLDSHIVHDLARKAKEEDLAGKGPGLQRFHSRTVAHSHSTLSLRLNHGSITVTCHMSQPTALPQTTKIPHFQFPTMLQEN